MTIDDELGWRAQFLGREHKRARQDRVEGQELIDALTTTAFDRDGLGRVDVAAVEQRYNAAYDETDPDAVEECGTWDAWAAHAFYGEEER